jgi:VIT1/CCC1 family predicted Fe2+/Mn2+ transporter
MKNIDLSKFSFGITAAITTSLAIIIGLGPTHNPKIYIISTLLVLAIADNLTDSLGIHIYRESQCIGEERDTILNTISNFLTRLTIMIILIIFVYLLPMQYAILASVIVGLSLLIVLSYLIAIRQKKNPYKAVLEHIGIVVVVIIISYFLGQIITNYFNI